MIVKLIRTLLPLAIGLLVLLPASAARADDWAVLLGEIEIRTEPGFSKPAIQKSTPLAIYKVSAPVYAKDEGNQLWYEIILREERKLRDSMRKGWVLRLEGDPDPLKQAKTQVYKLPNTDSLVGRMETSRLAPTGVVSPDGRWTEVRYESTDQTVRNELGYVPASLVEFYEDPDLTQLVPRLSAIREKTWPLKWKVEAAQRRILKGFTRDAVQLALGTPAEITIPGMEQANEVWLYNLSNKKVYVFFEDGRVVGWKGRKR